MAITAAMVKELRESTGVGMMDCKNALDATNGDIEAAVDWLRAKGLAKAAKKAGRVAAEGLVGVTAQGNKGALVEINSETDFVARNPEFQEIVTKVGEIALDKDGDYDAIAATQFPGADHTVVEHIVEAVAKIGENMSFRRAATVTVSTGVVGSYIHNQVAEGMGNIGILVGLESTGDADKLTSLGKQIAMHVAAADPRPQALMPDDLDADYVAKEKSVFVEQARESGKPDNIIEKMIEGRMRKFYQEVCLLSQTFVIDGENTIEQVVANAAKEIGADIKISEFVRFELGDGIEKKEVDFAAEVAATVGG